MIINYKQQLRSPVSNHILIQLDKLEKKIVMLFKEQFDIELENDEESIKCLSDFITTYRNRLDASSQKKWLNLISAFLGQTIIDVCGGKWIEKESSNLCIELDDGSVCCPFDEVLQHFESGEVYSIYSYFQLVSKIENQQKFASVQSHSVL